MNKIRLLRLSVMVVLAGLHCILSRWELRCCYSNSKILTSKKCGLVQTLSGDIQLETRLDETIQRLNRVNLVLFIDKYPKLGRWSTREVVEAWDEIRTRT